MEMKKMKKLTSLLLAVVMAMGLMVSAWAETDSVSYEVPGKPVTVSANTVESVLGTTSECSNQATIDNESIALQDEWSMIYLKIEAATEKYNENPTPENAEEVRTLVQRKNFLEEELTKRGYKILSDEEVGVLFGNTASIADYGPKPNDTANTKYVASPISYVAASDGHYVQYYYVTAINKSNKSNLVSMPEINLNPEMWNEYIQKTLEIYADKIIGEIASSNRYLKWAPYELIRYDPHDSNTTATHTIDATYATTARFVWMYVPQHNQYMLCAVTHSCNIDNNHTIRWTYLGQARSKNQVDNHTEKTPNFDAPGSIAKARWESGLLNTYIERVSTVKYKWGNTVVAKKNVPYAQSYSSLN